MRTASSLFPASYYGSFLTQSLLPLLFLHSVDDFVERDDAIHDWEDVFHGSIVAKDFIVLVNTKFHLDLTGLDTILQAKERRVDHQLLHLGWCLSGLQIVNTEKIIPKYNCVWRR